MICFHPLVGCRGPDGWMPKPANWSHRSDLESLTVRCGQCKGCRIHRTREWSIRLVHHAETDPLCSFVTLTYDDDHLPDDLSIRQRDLQLFIKAIRKRTRHHVSYYACGEYGERKGVRLVNPHYHLALFGVDVWKDRRQVRSSSRFPMYESPVLTDSWRDFSGDGKPRGAAIWSDLTLDSAAYVAGYIRKKLNGLQGVFAYNHFDIWTGEVFASREPPFALQSKVPPIGLNWIKRHWREVYKHDSVFVKGTEVKPPKFYDDFLQTVDLDLYCQIKADRDWAADHSKEDRSWRALAIKERLLMSRDALLDSTGVRS